MKSNKMHKIDLIFIIGIIIIPMIGGIIDGFYWKGVNEGGFPVYSLLSILASYALWLILLIYSNIEYNNKEDKPKYVKWYMCLIIYFIHIIIAITSMGIIILIPSPKFSQTKAEPLYTLTYYDDYIPGSKSDIQIYNDKVEITTTKFCSAVNCNPKTETEIFKYSKENIEKLITFINNNFSNKIKINANELTKRQEEVITGLLLGEYFFETNIEEYKYKIEYSKNDNLSYDIYFKEDNSILVKKLKINNDYDIVKIDTYSLNFSKESIKVLTDYIEKEIKNNNKNSNIIYKYSTLKKDEINIFNSIVENDESYLKNIENEPKLSYTISYNGINCPTPILYLYSDNSYEYYYTFATDDQKLIPKTGTYNYDITKIIKNIDKYKENNFGPYTINDANGNNHTTYNTNTELKELLNSLNLTLEKCAVQQE